MRKFALLLLVCCLPLATLAQSWSNVTAANIYDPSSGPNKLAFGTLQFTATDARNFPLAGYNAGDGVAINAPIKCSIRNGAVSNCRVPNPASTIPPNIAYRVEVISAKGTATYVGVVFTGDFNLDTYVPSSAPVSTGQSVDKLTVADLTVTTSCTGCGEGGTTGQTPDATTTTKGKIMLAGALGGTADSPTVPGLAQKVDKTTTVNGHALNANVTVTKGDVGLGNVENTSDAAKPISTATQTALDAKAAASHVHDASIINSGTLDVARIPNLPYLVNTTQLAQSKLCTGNDKVNGYDAATGAFTCGTDQTGVAGGGTNVSVNGSAQSDVNLNSTTPAAEAGYVQAKVQNSSGSVSIEIPIGTTATTAAAGNHNHSGTYEPAITTLSRAKGGSGQDNTNLTFPASGTLAITTQILTALSQLADDSTHRLVTDAEKTSWNGKAAANASMTINSVPCALGSTCTVADSTKVVANGAITGATKTKITYDAKGLVTAGADATTADISDSTDKRYISDAQRTVLTNTSGANTGDETGATIRTKLGITTLSGSNTGDQDLSGLVPKTTTVAGKALSGNITLACSDLSDDGAACAKNVGTGASDVAAGDHTHALLGAAYLKRPCEITITGSGSSGVLQDADDEAAKCLNLYGASLTVESVSCRADAGTPTVMVTITGGANVLTGNLTCGTGTFAAGTLSGTPAVAASGSLDFSVISAGGTAHEVTIAVGRTL